MLQKLMFKYTHDKSQFSFSFLNQLGVIIPISDWENIQSEFLSQIAILTELHDNGLADYTENSCKIDTLSILRLSDIDKQILDLPDTYPFEIFVESDGVLTLNT